MLRIIRYTLAGILGMVIAWAIMEPTSLMPDRMQALGYGSIFAIGGISGFFAGLLLGIAGALSGISPRDAVKSVIICALVGAGGGIIGLLFGNSIYNLTLSLAGGSGVYGSQLPSNIPAAAQPSATPGLMAFLLLLIGRGSGWALIGGFIGVALGLATGSPRKMVNGAIGGLIGGGLGGSIFEILVWVSKSGAVGFFPWTIRLISFSVTGASIGLFIGFIEEMAKKAWLTRLIGRNEGRQYELYKPSTVLGSSELADLPVFGDPDVSERHAIIRVEGNRHVIEDLGSFYGTKVNGNKITTKQSLRDGDIFEIGKVKFEFHDKATARLMRSAASTSRQTQIPTSQHICPFCGTVKDASGNCSCSIGAPPSQGTQTVMQQTQISMPPGDPTQQIPAAIPQPSSSGARLVGSSGLYGNQTHNLKSETFIGREATKDIPLSTDSTVSRNHAKISFEAGVYVLYDDGSTNGTYANGAKVTRHELKTGDLIQIGSTKFRFEN